MPPEIIGPIATYLIQHGAFEGRTDSITFSFLMPIAATKANVSFTLHESNPALFQTGFRYLS
jgi:hypothetical protein